MNIRTGIGMKVKFLNKNGLYNDPSNARQEGLKEGPCVDYGYKTCKYEVYEKDWEEIEGIFCPYCSGVIEEVDI